MYLEGHWFIYAGVNTSTRKYQNIACRSWEYVYTWIDFLKISMEQIIWESYKQCHVYDDIYIIVCFEIEEGEMQCNRTLNAQRAKRR